MVANAKVFPLAHHNDGMMDLLMVDGNIERRSTLQVYVKIQKGAILDSSLVDYSKVLAYRWAPKNQDEGYVSIDGESFLFEPFQAEIHKGVGAVIMKNWKIPGASAVE